MSFSDSSSATAPPSPGGDAFTTMRLRSPKRKRSADLEAFSLPSEVPETPWKKPKAKLRTRATSPYGEKLAGQFHKMKLAERRDGNNDETHDAMEVEETRPATKRRRETNKAVTVESVEEEEEEEGREHGNGITPSPPVDTKNGQAQERRRLRSPPPIILNTKRVENKSQSPEDDGDELSSDPDQYGIAYIPTPMQRYARSQKRIQQIKDYKSRESKEAREKRTAKRRRRRSQSQVDMANTGGVDNGKGPTRKAVHFHL